MTDKDQDENAAALAHLEALGIHKPAATAVVAAMRSESAKIHDLKVQTRFWSDLWNFKTTAQLRQDDRSYRVGDILLLREYNPQFGYTGMSCKRRVTHILRHEDVPYGVRRGWCILSTSALEDMTTKLAQWRANLRVTQASPVLGDALHGPALAFVLEQLDTMLGSESIT